MDTQREFDGRTLDQAIQNALEAMGLERHQLKYEILSYGSSGLFGLVGAKKARIRVNPPVMVDGTEGLSARELVAHLAAETGVASEAETICELETVQPIEINDKNIELVQEVASRIVHGIVPEAHVLAKRRPDCVQVDISGDDAGILIGKHGQTLEAIQYIVDKIVSRSLEGRFRIQMDVEGYLEKRWSHQNQLALAMADKAKAKGQPTVIGQMNARDRRIVHLALKSDPDIRTQSRGDGYLRKLIIFPKTRITRGKSDRSET